MSEDPPHFSKAQLRVAAQSLDGVIAAVRELEGKALEEAFKTGFRQGWELAFRTVLETAAKNAGKELPADISFPGIRFENAGPLELVDEDTEAAVNSSVQDNVFTLVKRRPGLRGINIVADLEKERGEVSERTVRTALYRLKRAGKLKVVDGRWYTPQNVPPNPLSQDGEEDDDAPAS